MHLVLRFLNLCAFSLFTVQMWVKLRAKVYKAELDRSDNVFGCARLQVRCWETGEALWEWGFPGVPVAYRIPFCASAIHNHKCTPENLHTYLRLSMELESECWPYVQ
jgi:hypothetical protein